MSGGLFTIRNDQEFCAAVERAQELMGWTNDSGEERELAALCEAVDAYAKTILQMMAAKAHNDNGQSSS